MIYPFPFSAIQGQDELKTALLLCAVDPLIGGVLIEGPRGTAKSTSARALAELLPSGRFVNLPLGAGEEQLIGSLNIEAALQGGAVEFKPGLLARAHEGVLYVDEINLLPDHLVDVLLDVSASGVNHIERDGISHQHAARFVLAGTMNPEEGQLRPQLLDRFGLFIQLQGHPDTATRQAIVRTRLAFDENPEHFVQQYQQAQQQLQQQLIQARQRQQRITYSDAHFAQVSSLCSAANTEGVRADLTLLRAARAHAALTGGNTEAPQITQADIDTVKEWVLAHRRHPDAGPQQQNNAASEPEAQDRHRQTHHQQEHHQQKQQSPDQSETQVQAQTPSTREDNSPTDTNDERDWGALPPELATDSLPTATMETPAAASLKGIRSLPAKKR